MAAFRKHKPSATRVGEETAECLFGESKGHQGFVEEQPHLTQLTCHIDFMGWEYLHSVIMENKIILKQKQNHFYKSFQIHFKIAQLFTVKNIN
jgi:hypothetical protein